MSKSIIVLYHAADYDGICSYHIAKGFLEDQADYLGWDYDKDVPDLSSYETVYLIDISLPKDIMIQNADKIIWIDHHISKIRELDGVFIAGYRIDGVAACRLAWQWFLGKNEKINELPEKQDFVDEKVWEPEAVRLLGQYDIWDKRNPNVDLFQFGVGVQKNLNWNILLGFKLTLPDKQYPLVRKIISDGQIIQDYISVENARAANERGFDVVWEGLNFRVLNQRSNSMVFEASLKDHHDACLAYYFNGKVWKFSLYHIKGKEQHDLSLIAGKFGGGGHKGACGFVLKELPDIFLKNNG